MYNEVTNIRRKKSMIISAIQRGNMVYVYGEKNNILMTKPGELSGYTSSAVSIRNKAAKTVTTYDEKGHILSVKSGS